MVTLYPFDFEEFMMAMDYSKEYIKRLKQVAYERNLRESINEDIHNELLDLFRKYIVIGGLPAAINEYKKTKTFSKVRDVLKNLYNGYKIDVEKYARKSNEKIIDCFDSIPMQLKQQNKKFKYSLINVNARSREYSYPLHWLNYANMIIKCCNLKTLKEPLELYKDSEYFKVYCFDTGILLATLPETDYFDVLNGNENLDIGGVYENAVACILNQYYDGDNLMYYTKGQELEIDFVTRNRKQICPIEVKSGNNIKSPSLNKISKLDNNYSCIKVSNKLINDSDDIINKPFYLFALIYSHDYE